MTYQKAPLTIAIIGGAALGFLIWDLPRYFLPLLILIPPIIWHISSTLNRFVFALAYFMAGAWPVAAATQGFFHHDQAYLGVVMLAISSAAHCLPLIFIKPLTDKHLLGRSACNVSLLVVGLLPPLGFFAWVHPFYVLGVYDNILVMGISLALLGFVAFSINRQAKLISTVVLVLAAYTQQYPSTHINEPSAQFVMQSTQLGGPAPANQSQAQLARFLDLVSEHNLSAAGTKSVTVYPENILGVVSPQALDSYSTFLPNLSGPMLIGASLVDENGLINALVDPYSGTVISARFPMPVGSWRPWDSTGHHSSDLFKTNVVSIADTEVLFLFCAEEYMPIIWLTSAFLENPKAIVSVSNTWWAGKNSSVAQRQRLHAALLSRIIRLPIYRALNE